MRIDLHIGLEAAGASRLQTVLAEKRDQLRNKGVLFSRSPGSRNHTRLFMALSDPDHIDPLRYNRGVMSLEAQTGLQERLANDISREIEKDKPDLLILSACQMAESFYRDSELARLKGFLAQFSEQIRIIAHVDAPARMLMRAYAQQIREGRAQPLSRDLALCGSDSFWQAATTSFPKIDPLAGQFTETQGAPFWLDLIALREHWGRSFGNDNVVFRPYQPEVFYGTEVTEELRKSFEIAPKIGRSPNSSPAPTASAASIERARQMNDLLLRLLAKRSHILPRKLWHRLQDDLAVPGAPLPADGPRAFAEYFAEDAKTLEQLYPALKGTLTAPVDHVGNWAESNPGTGFRASQYLAAFLPRINHATREQAAGRAAALAGLSPEGDLKKQAVPSRPSARAEKLMPPLAIQNFARLNGSAYAPHNRMGKVDETAERPAYSERLPRAQPNGSTGNVIVGCMKNEAPYILEWVAYHRAVGFDNFLIYTNDCTDGTDHLLSRLQELGILQHRNNDNWRGKSPQQHALNQSLKEPLIRNAAWIAHIDVDEYINIRCGNGTLEDLFAEAPEATNVAMTWRLFGHNGVTNLKPGFVVEQFDACAPKYCPKPHTVWGYKTLFKNIGAYQKISCHRPNKLQDTSRDDVKWINGSGRDMTEDARDNGWRNSRGSIGYDLVQLNHYALRSAESFLIKRQRGRALHVDRSIGLNYWIRMDWNDHKDITIQRNLPRLRAELDRLMQDQTLADLHQAGLDWHHAKAKELHNMPEFQELYEQAVALKLTAMERVAYALALDMES